MSSNNLTNTEDSAALMLVSLSNIEINNIRNTLEKMEVKDLAKALDKAIDLLYWVSQELKARDIDFGDFM